LSRGNLGTDLLLFMKCLPRICAISEWGCKPQRKKAL